MIAEIIFGLVGFTVMWFLVFKTMLKYNENKLKNNLAKNIEKQEEKEFSHKGKVIILGKKKEEKTPKQPTEKKPEAKKTKKATKKKVVKKAIKNKK